MRKPKRSGSTRASTGGTQAVPLVDIDARSGRVSGAQVAFGAPGPRIDLDRVLESWRDGTTVGGAAQDQSPVPPHPTAPRTVSLSDGTTISFTVAGASLVVDS